MYIMNHIHFASKLAQGAVWHGVYGLPQTMASRFS
jgi:hypothetical protein